MKTLTFEKAFSIQFEHVAQWSKVLNRESYFKLIEEVKKRNSIGYNEPYEVTRGNGLTNIVENMLLQN
jgi:hypothetical protein